MICLNINIKINFINLSYINDVIDLSQLSLNLSIVNIYFRIHYLLQLHPICILVLFHIDLVVLHIYLLIISLDFSFTIFSLDHPIFYYFVHAQHLHVIYHPNHLIFIFSFLFTIMINVTILIFYAFIFIIFMRFLLLSHLYYDILFLFLLVQVFKNLMIIIFRTS